MNKYKILYKNIHQATPLSQVVEASSFSTEGEWLTFYDKNGRKFATLSSNWVEGVWRVDQEGELR